MSWLIRSLVVPSLAICLLFGACTAQNREDSKAADVKPPAHSTIVQFRAVVVPFTETKDSIEPWIVEEMKALGYPGAIGTADGWQELTDRPYTVHDSRRYGFAAIRVGSITEKDVTIIISSRSRDEATFTLANQPGAHRLITHTISSSVGSLKLHMAFAVVESAATAPRGRE